jgi:outer membrane protein OmpA-like peptidoglycan-associated protein
MAFSESAGAQDHGEGENYFVSMTDMMVGMLFIFIIMLMSFALLFRQQTDATKATQTSKIEHANDIEARLTELEKRITQQINRVREATLLRQKLLRDIDALLRREDLIVQVDESNGVLHLTEDTIRFQQNDASLNERARQNVGKIARVLARVLPAYLSCARAQPLTQCQNQTSASIETVFIEGHTDTVGQDDQNWALSAQRPRWPANCAKFAIAATRRSCPSPAIRPRARSIRPTRRRPGRRTGESISGSSWTPT